MTKYEVLNRLEYDARLLYSAVILAAHSGRPDEFISKVYLTADRIKCDMEELTNAYAR